MGDFLPYVEWFLGFIVVASSLGMILVKKPVYASLCFLVTLLTLSAFYLELSSEFVAAMQVLIYAGAILVIFMFVIVLFQDAHHQLAKYKSQVAKILIFGAATSLTLALLFLIPKLMKLSEAPQKVAADYGSVVAIGKALYLDYFFPFESVIWLFLIAIVGSLYIAKKEA